MTLLLLELDNFSLKQIWGFFIKISYNMLVLSKFIKTLYNAVFVRTTLKSQHYCDNFHAKSRNCKVHFRHKN